MKTTIRFAALVVGMVFLPLSVAWADKYSDAIEVFKAAGESSHFFKDSYGGNFEFGAEASAVAITAGASATTGSTGSSAGASAGKSDATTVGEYRKGMGVGTVAKGGLMYAAALGGQKYSYKTL